MNFEVYFPLHDIVLKIKIIFETKHSLENDIKFILCFFNIPLIFSSKKEAFFFSFKIKELKPQNMLEL